MSNTYKFESTSSKILSNSERKRWAFLTIILLGILIYSNTITHDYAMDDGYAIYNNELTKKGIDGIPGLFKYDFFMGTWMYQNPDKTIHQILENSNNVDGGRYRPLSLATFALEVELFGLNPTVSHIVNILLYIITTLVLYCVLRRMIKRDPEKSWYQTIPFMAAVLFLVHPLHTEVVANIKGRDEILALLGALLALSASLRYIRTHRFIYLVWSFLALFLGMLSKENAITYVAIIPLVLYLFTEASAKRKFIAWIPLLLSAGAFIMLRASVLGWFSQPKIDGLMNNPYLLCSTDEKFATIAYTLGKYLQLLVFPHPLTWDYYPFHISIIDWNNIKAIIPAILYLLMGIYAIWGTIKKRDAIVSISIWMYLIPLSIVSNIFFPIGTFMSERFVFMSSIGYCILLAWLLSDKLYKGFKFNTTIVMVLFIIISGLYSAKTFTRNPAWKNNFTLLTTDIKTSSNSAKSHHDLACEYFLMTLTPENKDNEKLCFEYYNKAIIHLQRSIKINKEYRSAYRYLYGVWNPYTHKLMNKIALVPSSRSIDIVGVNEFIDYLRLGKFEVSPTIILSKFEELQKKGLQNEEKDYLIGFLYGCYLDDYANAAKHMERALSLKYNNLICNEDLAITYNLLGQYDKALVLFLQLHDRHPQDKDVINNIAVTYEKMGDLQNAKLYFEMLK